VDQKGASLEQIVFECALGFSRSPKCNDFLRAITVAEQMKKGLFQARDTIRDTLRAGLGNWTSVITKDQLFEREFLRKSHTATVALRPRFRMQGSFAYQTVNDPAQQSQQIDLDYGVYMPTEFIQCSQTVGRLLPRKAISKLSRPS